jgi:hypothetical protein
MQYVINVNALNLEVVRGEDSILHHETGGVDKHQLVVAIAWLAHLACRLTQAWSVFKSRAANDSTR